jgi:hypothetical protein
MFQKQRFFKNLGGFSQPDGFGLGAVADFGAKPVPVLRENFLPATNFI